jgi:hypothetical protein
MSMTGLAGAQTPLPDALPSGGATSTESRYGDTSSSPTGAPAQLGSATAAAVPANSLQEQVTAQRKDIDALIEKVKVLTEQLQGALSAPDAATVGSGGAQQVGVKQPNLESLPETVVGSQTGEELGRMRQALDELAKEQAAAQAPADEKQKKQLEIQRKQIDLLNKMVKLLVSELEKQGPAVSRMQTQVATLQARSRQAAQRDQELANGLDNLVESVDAAQRKGPQFPANLAQWFLPSGTNETPFSIYNDLGMLFNCFTSHKGVGQAQFDEWAPIFLLQLNNRFLFEAELEFASVGVDVGYAQLDWIATDWLTVVIGRYLTPLGQFTERYHARWINKLPDFPLFEGTVIPADFSLNGAQLRGARYILNSPVKTEYSFYAANGWGVPGKGTVTDFANLAQVTDTSGVNNAIAFGGRIGLWVPSWGLWGGISYLGNRPYTAASDGTNVDVWDLDLNYHYGNWDFRGEMGETFQHTADFIGNNILRRGGYAQLAYRPYNVANRWLQNTEAVFRYSVARIKGFTTDQLDLTAFTFLNQVPASRNQFTIGLNYYPYPSMIFKLAYEINQEIHGINLKDNLLVAALGWGF